MAHNGSRMCDTVLSVNGGSSERAAFCVLVAIGDCVIGFSDLTDVVG